MTTSKVVFPFLVFNDLIKELEEAKVNTEIGDDGLYGRAANAIRALQENIEVLEDFIVDKGEKDDI